MNVPVYDLIGAGYRRQRRTDPRIAAAIQGALGDAQTIVNIGAGTSSYEPADPQVTAVEPSDVMAAQRPQGAAPCIRATAEALPFADRSFDAAMAILSMHHWTDWRAGLAQMRRVAKARIVLLTFDASVDTFWLTRDYLPEVIAIDRKMMPPIDALAEELGKVQISPVPVPHDCVDGFLGAFWRRPDAYLDPEVRQATSVFAKIDAEPGLSRLRADLASGVWHARYQDLQARPALDVGYRLVSWERP